MNLSEKDRIVSHLTIFVQRSAAIRSQYPDLFVATLESLIEDSMGEEGRFMVRQMGGISRVMSIILDGKATPFIDIVLIGCDGAEYSLLCTSVPRDRSSRIIKGSLQVNKTNSEIELSLVDASVGPQAGTAGIPCHSFGDMISALAGQSR